MIEKISKDEKEQVIKNLSFFDFKTYSLKSGKGIIIELDNNSDSVRYCDVQHSNYDKNVLKKYLKKERELVKIPKYFAELLNDEILIYKEREKWITNKRIAPKMNEMLKNAGVSENDCMLKISTADELKIFTKSILRYNTFASYIFPAKRVVVAPTDHMDVFVFSEAALPQQTFSAIERTVNTGVLFKEVK